MSKIEPYPTPWARMVDFFPSLYYSIQVDPDVPMLEYQGHVSVSTKIAKEFKKLHKTDLGEINVDPLNRKQLRYRAGSPDNTTTFKAKDAWREVQSVLETPDVTGSLRTLEKPIPKILTEYDLFSTGAPLTITETARGCYPRKMRETTGLPLFNVIRHAKNELITRDIANYKETATLARFKRMRSVWKTKTIVGWSNLSSVIRPLCEELTRNKWFQDAIEIKGFNIPINQLIVDGHIYTMQKLHRLLAI